MSKTAKWIIGIVVALVILQFAMPFVWQLIFPATNAYGYGMPMMRGYGYGMMGGYGMHMGGFGFFGGMFMWLFPLATLILIALGIAYLWKKLTEKPQQ
jgi:small-conductance mechanosensitive channel